MGEAQRKDTRSMNCFHLEVFKKMKQRTERRYKNLANKGEKSLTWISITDERAFETAVFEMQGTSAPGNYCCFLSPFATVVMPL